MLAAPARILAVNAGSSSLKLRVLDADDNVVSSRESGSVKSEEELHQELEGILAQGPVEAAGHRIVHGGPDFTGPAIVDPGVEKELERLSDLAPLHNPPAVGAMRALAALAPGLPTVACFDTAFHATMPAAASTYAVPAAWRDRWPLRRYGFHGLSHAYASRRVAELLDRPLTELRTVTAHLGAGASLAAVMGGRSVDTTMGFTPLDGLVMATRSGSVDPGLLLWVQHHGDIDAEQMERALDRESGLSALSGHSGDMREVIAGMDQGDERCRLAFDVYIHRLAAAIAAMATAMGGIDALAFTGGVGENSPRIRQAASEGSAFLGVEIDTALNTEATADVRLSPDEATVTCLALRAREDIEIAAQVRSMVPFE